MNDDMRKHWEEVERVWKEADPKARLETVAKHFGWTIGQAYIATDHLAKEPWEN